LPTAIHASAVVIYNSFIYHDLQAIWQAFWHQARGLRLLCSVTYLYAAAGSPREWLFCAYDYSK